MKDDADIKFKPQAFDLGRVRLDLAVRNLTVVDEWIEGDLEVNAEALGQRLDETFHFKTKNNAEYHLPLSTGAQITLKAILETPHRVCIEATLEWGPIKLPGRECVEIAGKVGPSVLGNFQIAGSREATMAEKYGPFTIQSGKVTKQAYDASGQTADHAQWYEAPPDRYFVEESWHIEQISAHGKNAYVNIEQLKRTPVEITLPNGKKVTTALVTAFLVRAHAETGSGYSTDVRTAWAEGNVTAELEEYR